MTLSKIQHSPTSRPTIRLYSQYSVACTHRDETEADGLVREPVWRTFKSEQLFEKINVLRESDRDKSIILNVLLPRETDCSLT